MIVDQNEPAEAVPEDAGDNMHQAQVVEEMNEQGIVPPRSVAEGTATDRRKYTIKYRAWLGLHVVKEKARLEAAPGPRKKRLPFVTNTLKLLFLHGHLGWGCGPAIKACC